jgi:hypothetical protein
MDDDLRDLLDPSDDARLAALLQQMRDDLLTAPDEVTAARHRRQRRTGPVMPSHGRRIAVAVTIAVVGTGAALATTAPPPMSGSAAGESVEVVEGTTGDEVEPPTRFAAPTTPPLVDLPAFTTDLPSLPPAPATPPETDGSTGRDRAGRQPTRAPAKGPGGPPDDVPAAGRPASPPSRRVTPTTPSTPPAAPQREDARPAPPAGQSNPGRGRSDDAPSDAPGGTRRADPAQDGRPATPRPTG